MEPKLSARRASSAYPARLAVLSDPPGLFEADGALSCALDAPGLRVAIVGSRAAPPGALEFTRHLAARLAERGVVIVSGGALGVDAAAHEGALSVSGATIVVLPGGIDVVYPSRHRELFDRVRERGALVAIRDRGDHPREHDFLRRNQIVVALADHVVVTCAPLQSGTHSTARCAERLGRPLWVVPGAPWDPSMAGSAMLLGREGVRPLVGVSPLLDALELDADVRELPVAKRPGLEEDGTPRPPRTTTPRPRPRGRFERLERVERAERDASATSGIDQMASRERLAELSSAAATSEERSLLLGLRDGPSTLDALVLRTGLGVPVLRGLLLTWTVEGVVREGPAGVFRLAN